MWRRESGLRPDLVDDLRDLVDVPAVGGRPRAPLVAVDRAEVAVRVGPLVPDRDAAVLEPLHVGVAAQEPEQLGEDRAGVDLLGGDQREAGAEVEAHLVAEDRERAGAGAVGLLDALVEDAGEEVEVLLHDPKPSRRPTGLSTERRAGVSSHPHRAPLPPHVHPAGAADRGALRRDVLLREPAAGQPLAEAGVEAAGHRVLDRGVERADLDVGVGAAVGPGADDADVPAVERRGVGPQVEDRPGVLEEYADPARPVVAPLAVDDVVAA